MAASAGIGAKGTTFTWHSSLVSELTNIGGIPTSTDFIELTSHDSDDDFREWIPGLMDGGEIPLEGILVPGDTGQEALITDMLAKTKQAWIITYPNAAHSTWTGYGHVSKYEPSFPFDGKIGFTATIKITGKPSWDASP